MAETMARPMDRRAQQLDEPVRQFVVLRDGRPVVPDPLDVAEP